MSYRLENKTSLIVHISSLAIMNFKKGTDMKKTLKLGVNIKVQAVITKIISMSKVYLKFIY